MIRFTNGQGLRKFQFNASDWLLASTGPDSETRTLIVKAPTGSGKTIILLNYINDYLTDTYDKTSFVWLSIGSGDLEEQSKEKMDRLLPDRVSKTLSDALLTGFEGGEVTFINWESVTRDKNRALREGELKNIKDRIADAHRNGIEFIVIIDEEHRNNTPKAYEFMDYFSAFNIIRVSATTIHNDAAETYEIPESDVIASGLITKAMYVNDGVEDDNGTDMSNEYAYLVDLAIKKRSDIQKEYERLNKKIKPLVIIQFPDSSQEQIELVEKYLEERGFTYANGFVAKWLSDEKINIEGIEEIDAIPQFLVWKQALSTGWDCPRAKILVKLRENMSDSFETQTIGRIRRMPEAKHYNNDLLDNCFMYTFDEAWKEAALKDPNTHEVREVFIKPEGKELILTREVRDSASDSFGEREVREILSAYFAKKFKLETESRLSLEVKEDNKRKIAADSWVFGTKIDRTYKKGRFVKISDLLKADPTQHGTISREVNTHHHGRDVMHIINELHGIISISDSVVRSILKTLFHRSQYRRNDNLIALENREWYAFIINNREQLKEAFRAVKAGDLSQHVSSTQISLFDVYYKEREFRIPLSEVYKYDSSRKDLEGQIFDSSVYQEYQKNMVTDKTRSTVEQMFEYYCENNERVKWFYNNGDKGDKYFSIAYQDGLGQVRLFYPDYIVHETDGSTWIIETKGGESSGQTQNIDELARTKFDAFKLYIERHPDIKWGFVRNISDKLFLNNTEWEEAIAKSKNWISLDEFL